MNPNFRVVSLFFDYLYQHYSSLWYSQFMINYKLIFLLTLYILLLFSDSSYGAKSIRIYWENGSLMNETHYNGEKLGRVESCPDKMIFVSKGFFWTGEEGKLKNIVNESFCIDRTEVTQKKYKIKMGVNPSHNNGKNNPVENVSWFQAQQYCKSLNKRLPTEKEWEKAARSGSKTKYYWGNKINSLYLWYSHNSSYKSHPVALKKPNDYGLSDMLGNVYEWTDSWYSKDKKFRVLRGGSWANRKNSVRVSYRDRAGPSEKGSDIGFRCVKKINRINSAL